MLLPHHIFKLITTCAALSVLMVLPAASAANVEQAPLCVATSVGVSLNGGKPYGFAALSRGCTATITLQRVTCGSTSCSYSTVAWKYYGGGSVWLATSTSTCGYNYRTIVHIGDRVYVSPTKKVC